MRRFFLGLEAFDEAPTGAEEDEGKPVEGAQTPPEPDDGSKPPVETPAGKGDTASGNGNDAAPPVAPATGVEGTEGAEGAVSGNAAESGANGTPAPAPPPAADVSAGEPAPVPVEPVAAAAPAAGDASSAGAEGTEATTASNVEAVPSLTDAPVTGEASPEPVSPTPVGATNASDAASDVSGRPAQPEAEPAADAEALEALREQLALAWAMEEAVNDLGEAGETSAEIAQDLDESERNIQIADSLTDVAFVADRIEKATPAEAALMETAGDLAVAGTDVEPEQVVPSMESYIGTTIATEGIKETVTKILQGVMQFIERIWEKIRAYWRIHGSLPLWRKRIDSLRKRVQAASDEVIREDVTAPLSFAGLVVDDELGSSASLGMVDTSISRMVKTVHGIFSNYANGVVERGHDIVKALTEFDPNQPEKAANDLKNRLVGMHAEGMENGKSVTLPGNFELALEVYKAHPDEDVEAALERLRNSGVKLVKGRIHPAHHMARVQIRLNRMSAEQFKRLAISMLGNGDELLKSLEYFYEKPYQQMEALSKQIRSASAQATNAIGKAGEAAMAEGKTVGYYRSLLNFNKAFAQWTYHPFVPLYSYSLRTLRAMLELVEAYLKPLGAKAEEPGAQAA
jgi:phiKZ-like phage internal head proteins